MYLGAHDLDKRNRKVFVFVSLRLPFLVANLANMQVLDPLIRQQEAQIDSTLNTVNEQVAMKTEIKDCKSQIKHCLRFMCYCLMCLDCPGSFVSYLHNQEP